MKTLALSIAAALLLAGAASAAPANAPRPTDLTTPPPPPPRTGKPAPDKVGLQPTPPAGLLLPAIQTIREPANRNPKK